MSEFNAFLADHNVRDVDEEDEEFEEGDFDEDDFEEGDEDDFEEGDEEDFEEDSDDEEVDEEEEDEDSDDSDEVEEWDEDEDVEDDDEDDEDYEEDDEEVDHGDYEEDDEDEEVDEGDYDEDEDDGEDEEDFNSDDVDWESSELLDEASPIPTPQSDRVSTGDGGIADVLNMDRGSYQLTRGKVLIDSIVVAKPVKESRADTYRGLTETVSEMGILSPIHVMVTEEYDEYLSDENRSAVFGGYKYSLLDGFRRIYAGLRNKVEEVEAIVWRFNDPEYGNEISLILRKLLNNKIRSSWTEIWGDYQILEEVATINPSTMEYLLGLESGEAMKLKDIALATEYPEVWEELRENKKDLKGAYNMLSKLRRDEDKASMDDVRGISSVEDTEEMVDGEEWIEKLSEDEAREALAMIDDESLDFGGDNPEEDMMGIGEGDLQSTSERKPLDPVLRNAILRRDNFTCQGCRLGEGIHSGIALGTFEIHHTVSVMSQLEGARDDMGMIFEGSDIPRLITLCSTCHKLSHLVVIHGGKLGISQEEFDVLEESQKEKWKQIAKLAKVLLWAEKKSGKTMKRTEHIKLPESVPFWELDRINKDAIALGNQVEEHGRNYGPGVSAENYAEESVE